MNNILNPLKSKIVITTFIVLLPLSCFAKGIDIDFVRSGSTSITRADISETSSEQLSISGQLKRLHATPVSGHLHSYTYSNGGELLTESKHKVLGLRSKRGGMQLIPFNISIKNPGQETARVSLEYHHPGHQES